jgi:hypothetical protein
MKDCVWLKPERRCELEFVGHTNSGRLRHAVFDNWSVEPVAARIPLAKCASLQQNASGELL